MEASPICRAISVNTVSSDWVNGSASTCRVTTMKPSSRPACATGATRIAALPFGPTVPDPDVEPRAATDTGAGDDRELLRSDHDRIGLAMRTPRSLVTTSGAPDLGRCEHHASCASSANCNISSSRGIVRARRGRRSATSRRAQRGPVDQTVGPFRQAVAGREVQQRGDPAATIHNSSRVRSLPSVLRPARARPSRRSPESRAVRPARATVCVSSRSTRGQSSAACRR